ncbi:MAG: hypothetical protein J7639_06615 [Paenibacillaceae bacterium]|nr:hypothetical protein [Paenibacillaceae bacterium]
MRIIRKRPTPAQKLLPLALCAALLALPSPSARAQSAELAVGTTIGSVLATDIRAYVNGAAIGSMNIGGQTAVVAEDLRRAGFDVAWNPSKREVDIYPHPGKSVIAAELPPAGAIVPGTKLADVLATDIHTEALGQMIPSFNIGGQTAVYLRDLAPLLGKLEWNETARTASFVSAAEAVADPRAGQSAAYPFQAEQRGSTRFSVRFADDGMYIGDRRIGYGEDGRPMLSLAAMADFIGYKLDKCADGWFASDGTYGFRVGSDLETATLYWFGGRSGETKLTMPAKVRDGELYLFEYDLKELFGYTGNWDGDSRVLDIDYAVFDVQDYGLAEQFGNSWYYAGKGLLFAPLTSDMPMLTVTATANGGATYHGGSSLELTEQTTPSGAPVYKFGSAVPIEIGDNEITVDYRLRSRILYSQTFRRTIAPESLDPVINYGDLPYGVGDYSEIALDTPTGGLATTGDGRVEVKGTVAHAVGSGLVATVEQADGSGGWTALDTTAIPFADGRFDAVVTLGRGTGQYRVTLRSALSVPAPIRPVDPSIDVARFYVEYR